jgi:hypothetical protein
MPARKMRVELFDSEGNKYSVSFEGEITRDKAMRLLDLVELLGGGPSAGSNPSTALGAGGQLSKSDRTRSIVQRHFPIVWFTSREVQTVYEQELKEPISLSTVATYLARMATKGILQRTGPSNNLKYKLSPAVSQVTVKQRTP